MYRKNRNKNNSNSTVIRLIGLIQTTSNRFFALRIVGTIKTNFSAKLLVSVYLEFKLNHS